MTAKKDPTEVKSFDAVAQDTTHVVVTLNGESYLLDAQQALAFRGAINGAAVNLNY